MKFIDVRKNRAEIDLEAIAHNFRYTREISGGARVCAVVKADAYGHGAIKVAQRLMDEGCDFFAVANINEALELRDGGIKGTILILGYVLDAYLGYAIENDVSLALDDPSHLKKILEIAGGRPVRVHIKLDTGMNRTGFDAKHYVISPALKEAVKLIKENDNIIVEGLFSHFAASDDAEKEAFTKAQYERFVNTAKALEEMGIYPEIKHICNSASILRYKDMHQSGVRMGISLYGCTVGDDNYRPAMQFKTVIVNTHELKTGDKVGYGMTYTADRDMKIAVIGAGYADGLKRCLSGGVGEVLCHGKRAKIVGRVCMDMTMIDISDIPEAKVGDDVTLFGEDNGAYLSADEVAKWAGTISYEILCAVSKRIPRIYK